MNKVTNNQYAEKDIFEKVVKWLLNVACLLVFLPTKGKCKIPECNLNGQIYPA